MKRLSVLMVTAVGLAAGSAAEEYYLLKEDTPTYCSFISNPGKDLGYGWSSLADPESGNTYVVNGGYWNLYTPTGTDGCTLTFQGDKLILSPGNLIVMAGDKTGSRTVAVDDLEIRYGAVRTYGNYASAIYNFNGNVTFDTSASGYSSSACGIVARATETLRFNARIIASARETITYSGDVSLAGRVRDAFDSHGNQQFTWKRYYDTMQAHLRGDNAANLATNAVKCGEGLYVGCATLPGPVILNNAAILSVDDGIDAVSVNAIRSRDGYLRVPDGKTMETKGLDFAFADPSTYLLDGTNCYTGLSADEPYAPTNVCPHAYGANTCYLNVIRLGANASLAAPCANLSETLVTSGAGATLTVGDLVLSNAVLEGTGVINVTNSLSVTGPVLVRVDTTLRETVHLTLPVDRGTLDVGDFRVQDGINPFQYRLYVKIVDGVQQLRSRNLDLGANTNFSAATGYVTVKTAGSPVYLDSATNWSDEQSPHSNTNYFIGYNGRAFYCNKGGVFGGDSLTLGRFRYDEGESYIRAPEQKYTTTIDDLILLPYCRSIVAWGDSVATTFCGTMTVLTKADRPFTFTGEQKGQVFVMNNRIEGWTNAVMVAQRREAFTLTAGAGEPQLDFTGTNLNYHGRLIVSTNEIVRLGGDGFPNATVELATQYAITKTYPTAGKTYPVKCLALTDEAGYLEVAADTTLEVGSLALAGRLEKNGAGTLSVTGAAVAGAGAALKMNAGRLQTDSASALLGTALTLSDGASLAVQYPDGAAIAPSSATLPDTVNVAIEADVETLVADMPTIPFLTIPTPATDPAFAFNRPVRSYRFEVVKTVADGKTTYAAKFRRSGFAVYLR